jgi:DNA processing protein
LITARLALEQGREVFAVPGSPLDPRAEGTNGLIKQGAAPATESADIVSVLQPIIGAAVSEPDRDAGGTSRDADPASDERARIVALLSPIPVAIDDLIRLSQMPPPARAHGAVGTGNSGRLERHGGGLVSLV